MGGRTSSVRRSKERVQGRQTNMSTTRGYYLVCVSYQILVHSDCYNKNNIDWLINNRNSFIMVLEAGKPKIEAPADSVVGEKLLPGSYTALFSI